jgi:hypothetical protein
MAVKSDPVVDDPPVVADTAPAPCIVTDLVNVALMPELPLQVHDPDGIIMMSPSVGAASSLLIAA